jgi:hypothetical protein
MADTFTAPPQSLSSLTGKSESFHKWADEPSLLSTELPAATLQPSIETMAAKTAKLFADFFMSYISVLTQIATNNSQTSVVSSAQSTGGDVSQGSVSSISIDQANAASAASGSSPANSVPLPTAQGGEGLAQPVVSPALQAVIPADAPSHGETSPSLPGQRIVNGQQQAPPVLVEPPVAAPSQLTVPQPTVMSGAIPSATPLHEKRPEDEDDVADDHMDVAEPAEENKLDARD